MSISGLCPTSASQTEKPRPGQSSLCPLCIRRYKHKNARGRLNLNTCTRGSTQKGSFFCCKARASDSTWAQEMAGWLGSHCHSIALPSHINRIAIVRWSRKHNRHLTESWLRCPNTRLYLFPCNLIFFITDEYMKGGHQSVSSNVDGDAAPIHIRLESDLRARTLLLLSYWIFLLSNEICHIKESERVKVRNWLACQETSSFGWRAVVGLGQGQKGPMVMRVMLKVNGQKRNGQQAAKIGLMPLVHSTPALRKINSTAFFNIATLYPSCSLHYSITIKATNGNM